MEHGKDHIFPPDTLFPVDQVRSQVSPVLITPDELSCLPEASANLLAIYPKIELFFFSPLCNKGICIDYVLWTPKVFCYFKDQQLLISPKETAENL